LIARGDGHVVTFNGGIADDKRRSIGINPNSRPAPVPADDLCRHNVFNGAKHLFGPNRQSRVAPSDGLVSHRHERKTGPRGLCATKARCR